MLAYKIVGGYVVLACLNTLFSFNEVTSIAHLSLLHTTVFALSPLFIIVDRFRNNNYAPLGSAEGDYIVDMFLICYVTGCPSCPLHHPQSLSHAFFLLTIAIVASCILVFPSFKTTITEMVKDYAQKTAQRKKSKLQSLGKCPLCNSAFELQPSGEPEDINNVVEGTQGRNFHLRCLDAALNNFENVEVPMGTDNRMLDVLSSSSEVSG